MEEDTTTEEEDQHTLLIQQQLQASLTNSSKMSLIWRVGKKIAITGVVISSAPFVLPPLIVASSIGFALSVPFSIVFASYACTEKFMSVLLPNPDVGARDPGDVEDYGVGDEELVEDEVYEEIPQREEKMVIGGVQENGVGLERTDDTEVDDKVEDDPRVIEIKDVMEELDGVGEGKMGDQEMDGRVKRVALERTDGTEVEEDPRIVEIKDLMEEREIGEIEDIMVVKEMPIVEEREVKAMLIIEGEDESGSGVSGERAATSEMRHVNVEVSSGNDDSSSMVVKENVTTVRVERSSSSSKEAPYNEQKIWELINSLRKVVGYKVPVQPTFSEELKALYVFTGVDPPLAFKDPLDLVEISDKLRLLMTVVGVK